MPYTITKKGKCVQVKNAITKKIHAKCTTKTKAKAQVRLLNSLDSKRKKPRKK